MVFHGHIIMEGFNRESNEAGKGISIVLDKEKLRNKFWGRSQEVAATEYFKIFSIIKHIEEKGLLTEKEIKEVAEDLFTEFDVTSTNYEDIFTDKVISQIINSHKIDSISVDFNEAPAIIDRNSTVESVVKEWRENWKKMHGLDTPEAIEKRTNKEQVEKKAAESEQIILERMLVDLESIDFSDQEKLVDWLYEYYSHYRSDIDMHDEKIIHKFELQGYLPEDNDDINGMLGETLKDKERLGKVIIGYLLMNGALGLRGNWLKNLIEKWKKN